MPLYILQRYMTSNLCVATQNENSLQLTGRVVEYFIVIMSSVVADKERVKDIMETQLKKFKTVVSEKYSSVRGRREKDIDFSASFKALDMLEGKMEKTQEESSCWRNVSDITMISRKKRSVMD